MGIDPYDKLFMIRHEPGEKDSNHVKFSNVSLTMLFRKPKN